MSPATRCAQHHVKARQRRHLKAHERLARDRRQAQHAAEALQQALIDLGLPKDLITEIEERLRSQHKLLGKIVGVMCPPLFGCHTNTYGAVTIIIVKELSAEQYYVMCLETAISGPRLIRAWKRRHWIEHCFRTLKHLLATGACQVHHEDTYYGHLVLRLMGCFVLFYTSRVVCQGRLTMEEIIFSLKHYWRFVDCEALELKALSQGIDEKAA